MKIHRRTQIVNPGRLLGQLHDTFPELRPVQENGNQYARCTVGVDGSTVELSLPDNFDTTRLNPIFSAHDPSPDPTIPEPDFGQDIPADFYQTRAQVVSTLRQYLALASPTAAQDRAALKLLIRVVFFLCQRVIR